MAKSFVLLLALASLAVASPTALDGGQLQATLPIVSTFNFTNGKDLVARDRARIQQLRSLGQEQKTTDPQHTTAYNNAVVHSARVAIGSPPTTYSLIIDTGSANTWVGADRPYVKTSTSKPTGSKVAVSYGSGAFMGDQYLDLVSISPKLKLPDQSIGIANKSGGFDGFDGILGIGPAKLTLGTLSPNRSDIIPTVTDNLFKLKKIKHNSVGVSFVPTTQEGDASGELTWGGVDRSKFEGEITYAPVTQSSPANRYWGIDQALTYGSSRKSKQIMKPTAGIVDTGTTLTYIASDAFEKYKHATGSEFDEQTGLLAIPCEKFGNLKSLFFHIYGQRFELTPDAQAWPRSLNTAIGGTADKVYLIIADLGQVTGTGFDFINGMGFLQRFYSIYDTEKQQVGIARTPHTYREVNVPEDEHYGWCWL